MNVASLPRAPTKMAGIIVHVTAALLGTVPRALVMIVTFSFCSNHLSRDARKPVFGVSDLVRHKPACTSTGDG